MKAPTLCADDGRLRIGELERASLFTNSGITRLIDRMEAAGYVARERSDTDRRVVYVAITPQGHRTLNAVFPDHLASVDRHFAQHLSDAEAEAVSLAAKKVLAGEQVPAATSVSL